MNHGIHGTHGRRGWWRSRLFWLGVPGLVFLLWVWLIYPTKVLTIDAGRMAFEVRVTPETFELTMAHRGGRPSEWEMDIYRMEREERVGPVDHLLKWGHRSRPGASGLYYASMRAWVPSAVYLVCWVTGIAGWCFWKGRRFGRERGATPR